MYFVYILKWSRFYVWYTNNLQRRFQQHKNWKTKSTSKYWEIKLVWYRIFDSKSDATHMERLIKKSKNIKKRIGKLWFIKYSQE